MGWHWDLELGSLTQVSLIGFKDLLLPQPPPQILMSLFIQLTAMGWHWDGELGSLAQVRLVGFTDLLLPLGFSRQTAHIVDAHLVEWLRVNLKNRNNNDTHLLINIHQL